MERPVGNNFTGAWEQYADALRSELARLTREREEQLQRDTDRLHNLATKLLAAESALTSRAAAVRREDRQALRYLVNEANAVLSLSEQAIRETAGSMNLQCFQMRVQEAEALLETDLAPAPPLCPVCQLVAEFPHECKRQPLTADIVNMRRHQFKCNGSNLWTEASLREEFHRGVDDVCDLAIRALHLAPAPALAEGKR